MALTVPIRSASITSIERTTVSKLTHLTPRAKDQGTGLLANPNPSNTSLSDCEESDLLNPDPEGHNGLAIDEGTDYDPSRMYNRASPIADPDTDVTDPVSELEKDLEGEPLISDAPERKELILGDTGDPVPDEVVNYNESIQDIPLQQAHDALGLNMKTKAVPELGRIHYNEQYLNNVFYNKNWAKVVTHGDQCEFLNYCFPNVITHNLITRVLSSVGGLGRLEEVYEKLHLQFPLSPDHSGPVGDPAEVSEEAITWMRLEYDKQSNWFNRDLSADLGHTTYCLTLYAIIAKILLDPNFTADQISSAQNDILLTWHGLVCNHYDKLKQAEPLGSEWFMEAQYLHDLMWSFTDNPYSEDDKARCICAFLSMMASIGGDGGGAEHSTPDDMILKSDLKNYMIKELHYPSEMFLLPDIMEFPIFNKGSVRLAMDNIRMVEKEYPGELKTYCSRLNIFYRLMGCSFTITPDHPYAQYADRYIQRNMIQVLAEGDTAVSDTDGASDIGGPGNKVDQPWYKSLDYTGVMYKDGHENKELGPNEKPMQKPDYTMHQSFL